MALHNRRLKEWIRISRVLHVCACVIYELLGASLSNSMKKSPSLLDKGPNPSTG